MSLVVSNNVASLTAQHNLGRATSALSTSLERLSSGFKVNRGADGPASLVISEKQRAQIAGLTQAIENSEKSVAVVQTAEGALAEINSLLLKVRGLALDSANSGVNDEDALTANQAEITNALETISRIANNTQFTTKKLLNGESGVSAVGSLDPDVTFLRATADTTEGTYALSVSTDGERARDDAATAQTAATTAEEVLTVNGVAITIATGSTQDDVVARVNAFTNQTGVVADKNGAGGATRFYSDAFGSDASINVVSDTAAAGDTTGVGTTALTDTGVDIQVDITPSGGSATTYTGEGNQLEVTTGAAKGLYLQFGEDTTSGTTVVDTVSGGQGNITVQNNSLVFQIGPNENQTASVAISKVTADSLGLGVSGNSYNNLSEINVTSAENAQDSLAVIDASIDEITNLRGTLGAFQANTLESTANNLRATLENTVNAESVIRDTDFASEIAAFTKSQVLVQAGTSILANANSTSQLVLSLL